MNREETKEFLGTTESNNSAIEALKNTAAKLMKEEIKAENDQNIFLQKKIDSKISSIVNAVKILEQRNKKEILKKEKKANKRFEVRLSDEEMKTLERTISMLESLTGRKITRREFIQIAASLLIEFVGDYTVSNTEESFSSFITNYSFSNKKVQKEDQSEKKVLELLAKKIGYLDKNIMRATYAVYNDMYFSKHIDEWSNIYPAMGMIEPYFNRKSPLYELNKNIEEQLDKHYKHFQIKGKYSGKKEGE